MTSVTPVERIVSLLQAAHFRQLNTPIVIAGVRFDFDAAFVGTESTPDLVIVVDSTVERDERIRTKIEALARALDVVRSKRPLTVIVAGPRPRAAMLDAIAKVCRVLPVGSLTSGDEDATVKNWLAVLMPLNLPHATDVIADPLRELLQTVDSEDPVTAALLAVAPRGREEVAIAFHGIVQKELDAAEADE